MTRFLTLIGLIAFSFVIRLVESPVSGGGLAAMLVGFILLVSYLGGDGAARVGLPRVTGYVLLGIVVGPYALGILGQQTTTALRTIDELALALIALTAGGELKLPALRRNIAPILGTAFGVTVACIGGMLALVLVTRSLVPTLAGRPVAFAVAVALLLGVWCANSSPDATVAVINESEARGDLTDTILSVTIFKDVLVIVAFALALAVAEILVDPAGTFDAHLLGEIAWEVGGAGIVGAAAGGAFAFYLRQIGHRTVLATLVFAYALIILARGLHVELLLTAVAAGFVIENFSAVGDDFIHAIEANSLVIYAIFFALAGAGLDLRALVDYWPVALAIVGVRTLLTWGGAHVGARLARAPVKTRRLVWQGLISQAGVTIGLSLLVGRQFPDWGGEFVAVTGAVIIFHLLLGPILLKRTLWRAGETPRASAVQPSVDTARA